MGDPDYEARRKQEAERRHAEEALAKKRAAQDEAAVNMLAVMLPGLMDFFSGGACLTIEAGPDGLTIVRFRRG